MNTSPHLPSLSVVIPTYNGRHLLEKHLPRVAEILDPGDQIVIVDDASTDDTREWIKNHKSIYTKQDLEITVVVHEKNQRFAAAVNSGVQAAKQPYVFLLNNDVTPLRPDLKSQLLHHFSLDDQLFAVGCAEVRENVPNAPVFGRGTGGWQRGLMVHWYDANQSKTSTLWTAGGSMLFDRQKFLEIGGMDTLFYPAYEEDRDLSYRALKHGWTLLFDPQARVHHQHETTNASVFGTRNLEIMSWKNQYLLVWKNITDASLLRQHFLWLPYHLLLSNWRSHSAAGWGFLRALWQLPTALRQRQKVKSLWKKSDLELLVDTHY